MARDVMYYFDKHSPYNRHELGEIQTEFNMGLTIDGAKDSMQVQVFNYDAAEITPNTILQHDATNTWWIVKSDDVKRYQNESGFYYLHNLAIIGAVELLNNRDLTDCGFNDKTYTVRQFIYRLFQLSTYEFTPLSVDFGGNIDQYETVNYIKSYENYSPLSALRDLLNGYNCDCKLEFNVTNGHIFGSTLKIIPKTGNLALEVLDSSHFEDIRESKSQKRENYATTIISNAKNVISTLTKTYPQVGGMGVSSNEYAITRENAIVRLPTPIYKVNWVKLLHKVVVRCYFSGTEHAYNFYAWSNESMNREYDLIRQHALADFDPSISTEVITYLGSMRSKFLEIIKNAGSITIESGWSIKPIGMSGLMYQGVVPPQDNPNFRFRVISKWYDGSEQFSYPLLIGTKEDYEAIEPYRTRCMYYERGGREIHNFYWFGWNTYNISEEWKNSTCIASYAETDYGKSELQLDLHAFSNGQIFRIQLDAIGASSSTNTAYNFKISNTFFQINYIPMSDLKIKTDNANDTQDTQIYNQNGKLNDSVALSKLLDGYSKEVEKESITRYMQYTNFNSIPKVGQRVKFGDVIYVISSISYDFYPNETNNDNNVGYFIDCEFKLSRYVSTKSLMVSPNSNIRDYGIPQEYNVKRKQLYRDYYEFSFTVDPNSTTDKYAAISNYIEFRNYNIKAKDWSHTAIMKIDYDNPVGGKESWFYQLNTTAYLLDKTIYEAVDFNDNNIIGYDSQNIYSGWVMSRCWERGWRDVNLPISYVDDNGKFKGIDLQMVNKDNAEKLYDNISVNVGEMAMFSKHVFVGPEFYYGKWTEVPGYSDEHDTWTTNMQGEGTLTYLFDKPQGYIRDTISVSNMVLLDRSDNPMTGAGVNCDVDSIIEYEDNFEINFSYSTGTNNDYGTLEFRVNYKTQGTQVYEGAVDISDYSINEPNYGKDAIEVPVFEYSMQIGDTEDVEVGSSILSYQGALYVFFSCVVKPVNTTNTSVASSYFTQPTITGDIYNVDRWDGEIHVADVSGVVMSFEDNDTKLRIKLYTSQNAQLYQYDGTKQVSLNDIVYGVQMHQADLIGKDIIIYKNVFNELNYDIDNDEVNSNYQQELMLVIHNAKASDFDQDDLILNVNHYKLR